MDPIIAPKINGSIASNIPEIAAIIQYLFPESAFFIPIIPNSNAKIPIIINAKEDICVINPNWLTDMTL